MSVQSDHLILMRFVVFDIKGVSNSAAKHVIRAIEDFDGGSGCFASVASLSVSTGLSRASVKRTLRGLVDANVIRNERHAGVRSPNGGKATHRYFVVWSEVEKHNPDRSSLDPSGYHEGVVTDPHDGVTMTHSDRVTTNHSGSDDGVTTDPQWVTMTPPNGSPCAPDRVTMTHKTQEKRNKETQRNIGGALSPERPTPINDPDAIQKCLDQVETEWKASAGRQAQRGAGLKSLRYLLQNRQVTNPADWFKPAEAAFEYAKSQTGKGKYCMALTRFVKGEWEEDPETWQDSGDDKAKTPTRDQILADLQRKYGTGESVIEHTENMETAND